VSIVRDPAFPPFPAKLAVPPEVLIPASDIVLVPPDVVMLTAPPFPPAPTREGVPPDVFTVPDMVTVPPDVTVTEPPVAPLLAIEPLPPEVLMSASDTVPVAPEAVIETTPDDWEIVPVELPVVVIAPETLIASPPVKLLRKVTFPPAPALEGVVVIVVNWVFPDEVTD
jgi:hypothetical protein